MELNGIDWIGMEWDKMGWNGIEWYGTGWKVMIENGAEGKEDVTECSKKGHRQRKKSSAEQCSAVK